MFQKYATPALLAECNEAGIPLEQAGAVFKAGDFLERDRICTRAFNLVLARHRPNLALFHLLNVDHIEHAKGPQTPAVYAAIKEADDRVRDVWEELKKDFPGKATLVVVSDHGFFPYRQLILPNVALRKAGLLDVKGAAITGGRVRAVSEGGSAFLYVLNAPDREALAGKVADLFRGVEGVDIIIPAKDFPKYGVADPKADPNAPDLILSAKSGYAFADGATGALVVTAKTADTRGTHGYDPGQDGMHATFVAWGVGVRKGGKLGTIDNVNVAPTVAALLGIPPMKDVDGKVLDEVLAK